MRSRSPRLPLCMRDLTVPIDVPLSELSPRMKTLDITPYNRHAKLGGNSPCTLDTLSRCSRSYTVSGLWTGRRSLVDFIASRHCDTLIRDSTYGLRLRYELRSRWLLRFCRATCRGGAPPVAVDDLYAPTKASCARSWASSGCPTSGARCLILSSDSESTSDSNSASFDRCCAVVASACWLTRASPAQT